MAPKTRVKPKKEEPPTPLTTLQVMEGACHLAAKFGLSHMEVMIDGTWFKADFRPPDLPVEGPQKPLDIKAWQEAKRKEDEAIMYAASEGLPPL